MNLYFEIHNRYDLRGRFIGGRTDVITANSAPCSGQICSSTSTPFNNGGRDCEMFPRFNLVAGENYPPGWEWVHEVWMKPLTQGGGMAYTMGHSDRYTFNGEVTNFSGLSFEPTVFTPPVNLISNRGKFTFTAPGSFPYWLCDPNNPPVPMADAPHPPAGVSQTTYSIDQALGIHTLALNALPAGSSCP